MKERYDQRGTTTTTRAFFELAHQHYMPGDPNGCNSPDLIVLTLELILHSIHKALAKLRSEANKARKSDNPEAFYHASQLQWKTMFEVFFPPGTFTPRLYKTHGKICYYQQFDELYDKALRVANQWSLANLDLVNKFPSIYDRYCWINPSSALLGDIDFMSKLIEQFPMKLFSDETCIDIRDNQKLVLKALNRWHKKDRVYTLQETVECVSSFVSQRLKDNLEFMQEILKLHGKYINTSKLRLTHPELVIQAIKKSPRNIFQVHDSDPVPSLFYRWKMDRHVMLVAVEYGACDIQELDNIYQQDLVFRAVDYCRKQCFQDMPLENKVIFYQTKMEKTKAPPLLLPESTQEKEKTALPVAYPHHAASESNTNKRLSPLPAITKTTAPSFAFYLKIGAGLLGGMGLIAVGALALAAIIHAPLAVGIALVAVGALTAGGLGFFACHQSRFNSKVTDTARLTTPLPVDGLPYGA